MAKRKSRAAGKSPGGANRPGSAKRPGPARRHPQADLSKIKTISIRSRGSKVEISGFGRPFDPRRDSFARFVDSMPSFLAATDLRAFADRVAGARGGGMPFIVMLGAHVVKVGLSPVIIDLIDRGVITCVAMNSAAAIHDAETALFGVTSEDVAERLTDGTFGMSKETGSFINGALLRGFRKGKAGYGETLGRALARAPHARLSILAACLRRGIPATVHAAIGTDIIHQQPTMNGAATGELTFRDFKVLASAVGGLRGGGAVANIGSAVVMPEVFLKALTVARNLDRKVAGFTTANFDMIQHYRPRMNVVLRPTAGKGRGYTVTGHHEIMVPLLAAMIKLRMEQQ
jgi:hypothetical protein